MKKTTLLAVCATTILSFAQPASAQQGAPRHGMMDGAGPRMMWDADDTCPMSGPYWHGYPWRMNLTEAQRARAEQIFERARNRSRETQDKLQAAHARLRESMASPKRDRATVMNAYREIERLRAQQFEQNLDTQLEFDQLITK